VLSADAADAMSCQVHCAARCRDLDV